MPPMERHSSLSIRHWRQDIDSLDQIQAWNFVAARPELGGEQNSDQGQRSRAGKLGRSRPCSKATQHEMQLIPRGDYKLFQSAQLYHSEPRCREFCRFESLHGVHPERRKGSA
jgi:hypothetical protein